MNIFKIKAPLGYSTGTELYPLIKKAVTSIMKGTNLSCKPLMQLTLVNHLNGDALVYPLKVINVNEANIGTAANATAYMTLWNADAANMAKGVIKSGTGLVFEFQPMYVNTAIVLYAENS